MQRRPLNPIKHHHLIATIIILAVMTVTLAVVLYLKYKNPVLIVPIPLTLNSTTLQQIAQSKAAEVKGPLPKRLKIPKIGVDAALEYVGLTSGGAMGVPISPTNAAWFQEGPRPGDKGSAVIDGHFGFWEESGVPTVFNNLFELRKGDKLLIEDEKGAVITFIVSELQIYDDSQNASEVFVSNDGKAHLNLITCEGIWNRTLQSFPRRLVVFSDKEEE